ncbi:MAG TPA: anthranilate phosphoribosyltransferase [Gemmatimonadaceae bacterium]|nr:anthranilate phosphoribosyltransferase [Gemmatimonadaceae bacterium]
MTTPPIPSPLQAAISKLAHHQPISAEDAADAFDVIMRGEASELQVAAMLTGLRVRGETSDIVAGVVTALRKAMVRLEADNQDELVDTCGTGGGAVTTFNISTAAALLAAGAGVRVAKHGNRSFTSRCGSADVLEALGVRLDVPVATMEHALRQAGIVFMYAPLMHPAMRHVGPVRRELAIPTVMNVVGPLANPAGARRQVVGVADPQRVKILAGALVALDSLHSLVVHGEPGLDEISPLDKTRVVEVKDGATNQWTIDPAKYGYTGFSAADLAGGDAAENARIVTEALTSARARTRFAGARAAVVLNAAAAIYVSGKAGNYDQGVEMAREALDAGEGLAALERLRGAYSSAPD